ncbi:MAG: hypothetical protein AAF135_20825 [Bacteroidota bacterium]
MPSNTETYRRPKPRGKNRPIEDVQEQQKKKGLPDFSLGKLELSLGRNLLYALGTALVLVVMGGIYAYQDQMPVQEVKVNFVEQGDNGFYTESEIQKLMWGENGRSIVGKRMDEVGLQGLEYNLSVDPTIAHAEVYKSFMGVVIVDVQLRKPVGRLINNSGLHLYIDAEGKRFPISKHHTAFVPLIRGDFEEAVADTFACSTVESALPLLSYIQENDFWKAQIEEVVCEQSGEFTLIPAVGDTDISFGYPIRIQDKFSNLMDFYRQVMPVVGWKKYKRLSLKYKGQIVAKR